MNLSEIAKNYRFRAGLMHHSNHLLALKDSFPQILLDSSRLEGLPLQDIETEGPEGKKGNKLKCHVCGSIVTDEQMRIDVLGQTIHCRTNPGGFTYRFRCYMDAPGCSAMGMATTEHSWFMGYTWQIACCGQCGEHLGWLFKGNDRFYGLIEGRVVADDLPS